MNNEVHHSGRGLESEFLRLELEAAYGALIRASLLEEGELRQISLEKARSVLNLVSERLAKAQLDAREERALRCRLEELRACLEGEGTN